jgi:hypothetical protein
MAPSCGSRGLHSSGTDPRADPEGPIHDDRASRECGRRDVHRVAGPRSPAPPWLAELGHRRTKRVSHGTQVLGEVPSGNAIELFQPS